MLDNFVSHRQALEAVVDEPTRSIVCVFASPHEILLGNRERRAGNYAHEAIKVFRRLDRFIEHTNRAQKIATNHYVRRQQKVMR